MMHRNEKWVKEYHQEFKPIHVGDPVWVSNLVFKDYQKKGKLSMKSYKPNWTKEIYTVVSISHPEHKWQNPQYKVGDSFGNRLHVFWDSLQLLPSENPRITNQVVRPRNKDFFYSEEQRDQARGARGTHEYPTVEPLWLTEEARRCRRPSTRLREFYVLWAKIVQCMYSKTNDKSPYHIEIWW